MSVLWKDHKILEGTHAFLGASNYHWLNYTNDILINRYASHFATDVGTAMHELASFLIKNRIKINKTDKHLIEIKLTEIGIPRNCYDPDYLLNVLVPFVRDAIGFRMDSEILLFADFLCYGTADAIQYYEVQRLLRIHDLKTGANQASFKQLVIYAALFYLEYKKNPFENTTILRIYQNLTLTEDNAVKMKEQGIDICEDYLEVTIEPNIIKDVMDKIKDSVNILRLSQGKEPIE